MSKPADDATKALLVVLCDDVGGTNAPSRLAGLETGLAEASPGLAIRVVRGACGAPGALVEELSSLAPRRVVLGCAEATPRRNALLAALRRAGVSAAGTEIVDLGSAPGATETLVVAQSLVLMRAALARVLTAQLDRAVVEKTSFELGALSRRSLLRGLELARRPVATWRAGRCEGGPGCTACLGSCPDGALFRAGASIGVEAERCSGCGVCVAACRNGSFSLPGADLEALAAAAGVLIAGVKHGLARGVALTCRDAATLVHPGEEWLVLRIPSLEMVTVGWLLQFIAAGTQVRLVACAKPRCANRADALGGFLHGLAGQLRVGADVNIERGAQDGERCIELREPEATTQVLSCLGALSGGGTGWKMHGPLCPLGSVSIDSGACSFCEVCVGVCPTGALLAQRDGAGALQLSFEAGRCSACGACVSACPERVVSLELAIDGAEIVAGRRSVAVASEEVASCESCGAPLFVRLSAPVVVRAASSHPSLAPQAKGICANCHLSGRSQARLRPQVSAT